MRRISAQIAGTLGGRSMTCPQTAERGVSSDRPVRYTTTGDELRGSKVAGLPDGCLDACRPDNPTGGDPWTAAHRLRPGQGERIKDRIVLAGAYREPILGACAPRLVSGLTAGAGGCEKGPHGSPDHHLLLYMAQRWDAKQCPARWTYHEQLDLIAVERDDSKQPASGSAVGSSGVDHAVAPAPPLPTGVVPLSGERTDDA